MPSNSRNLLLQLEQTPSGECVQASGCTELNGGVLPDLTSGRCLNNCPSNRLFWRRETSSWMPWMKEAGSCISAEGMGYENRDMCPNGSVPQLLDGASPPQGVCCPTGAVCSLQGKDIKIVACKPGYNLVRKKAKLSHGKARDAARQMVSYAIPRRSHGRAPAAKVEPLCHLDQAVALLVIQPVLFTAHASLTARIQPACLACIQILMWRWSAGHAITLAAPVWGLHPTNARAAVEVSCLCKWVISQDMEGPTLRFTRCTCSWLNYPSIAGPWHTRCLHSMPRRLQLLRAVSFGQPTVLVLLGIFLRGKFSGSTIDACRHA